MEVIISCNQIVGFSLNMIRNHLLQCLWRIQHPFLVKKGSHYFIHDRIGALYLPGKIKLVKPEMFKIAEYQQLPP